MFKLVVEMDIMGRDLNAVYINLALMWGLHNLCIHIFPHIFPPALSLVIRHNNRVQQYPVDKQIREGWRKKGEHSHYEKKVNFLPYKVFMSESFHPMLHI